MQVPVMVVKRGKANEYISLLEKLQNIKAEKKAIYSIYQAQLNLIYKATKEFDGNDYVFGEEQFRNKLDSWKKALLIQSYSDQLIESAGKLQDITAIYVEVLDQIKAIDYDSNRIYT
jgi:hypothetical protein